MFDSKKPIKDKCCRSRFALFINQNKTLRDKRPHRCREPSRMPVKALKRALKKRRRRNFMRKYISRTVPKTSFLHKIVEMTILWKETVLCTGKVLLNSWGTWANTEDTVCLQLCWLWTFSIKEGISLQKWRSYNGAYQYKAIRWYRDQSWPISHWRIKNYLRTIFSGTVFSLRY